MTKPQLHYLPINARALPIRMLFHCGGIEYEDVVVTRDDVATKRDSYPMGQVPVLEDEGQKLCQSPAILLYVAQKAGMAPTDDLERARVLELILSIEDFYRIIAPSMRERDLEKKLKMREALMADDSPKNITNVIRRLEAMVKSSSKAKGVAVGTKISAADMYVYWMVDTLENLDGVKADILNEEQHPNLVACRKAVGEHPKIKPYLESIGKK